jgi:hypothetical protein
VTIEIKKKHSIDLIKWSSKREKGLKANPAYMGAWPPQRGICFLEPNLENKSFVSLC